MAAALWGLSVSEPTLAVASAEESSAASASSGTSGSDSSGASSSSASSSSPSSSSSKSSSDDSGDASTSTTSSSTSTKSEDADTDSDTDAPAVATGTATSNDADDAGTTDDVDTSTVETHHSTAPSSAAEQESTDSDDDGGTDATTESSPVVSPASAVTPTTESTGSTESSESTQTATAAVAEKPASTEEDSETIGSSVETLTPQQSVVVSVDPTDDNRQAVANQIAMLMGAARTLISILPVSDQTRQWLYDSLAGTRRTIFNQAPWLTPVQISGEGLVPIVGSLNAVDLEGDAIKYTIVTGPASGTLTIADDGTFTYVPNNGFTGVDSFVISATDLGKHINLLDPMRSASTVASLLVNQSAVTFVFNYTTGAQYWTEDARAALQKAAANLVAYFVVAKPVVITYEITGQNSLSTTTLASASSALISSGSGFFPTVVQNKLLTGVDSNGATADGTIAWNFAYPWAFGDTVSGLQYDFATVAMHEFLHSFGFLSYVQVPASATRRSWTIYDSFLQSADGTKLIGSDFKLNSALSANLTGSNGGIYFGGEGAVDEYGTLVPLYTPSTWAQGSSISHLDSTTFTSSNRKLMNPQVPTGKGVRALSDIELGIMKDLGFTLAPQGATSTLALVGFVFLRRRRDQRAESPAKSPVAI